MNADLVRERASATFNIEELTNIIDGSPKKTKWRREVLDVVFKHPAFDIKKKFNQTLQERYDTSIERVVTLYDLAMTKGWLLNELEMIGPNVRLEIGLALHGAMFLPVLERLCTEEQQSKWLPLALSLKVIGTYAQTELGHGTSLKNLETTATYDPVEQQFVLNTPLPSGMKWWPGSMANSVNHVILMAQLVVGGKNYGIQAFLVQIRDMDTHVPMPGVEMGDIGPKIGFGTADNGFLILRNYRIPRDNMLMRYAEVTPEGQFVSKGNEKATFGGMVFVRAGIVHNSYNYLSQACTIAVRYSSVRRQSELKPGEREPQVLDFQTQQYKLLPQVALSYAIHFARLYMIDTYKNMYDTHLSRGDFSLMPELHSQACGLKAYITDVTVEAIEICRRSCGGHGYLMASGICDLYCDALGSCTYEGENTVMYLQTARYLMKMAAEVASGKPVPSTSSYLAQKGKPVKFDTAASFGDLSLLARAFRQRARWMVLGVYSKLQQARKAGKADYVAWNEHSVQLVRASKAHLDSFVVTNFISALKALTTSDGLNQVLITLAQLHALHRVVEGAGEFLESGIINITQLDLLRQHEFTLLARLRPNAVALVDAFDWRDETLCSALGKYDGCVYEALYDMAKDSPMSKQVVNDAFHKYLKPLRSKF